MPAVHGEVLELEVGSAEVEGVPIMIGHEGHGAGLHDCPGEGDHAAVDAAVV
jgi:hypothetical protein